MPSPNGGTIIHTPVVLQRLYDGGPIDHSTLGWVMASLRKRSFGSRELGSTSPRLGDATLQAQLHLYVAVRSVSAAWPPALAGERSEDPCRTLRRLYWVPCKFLFRRTSARPLAADHR